MFVWSCIFISFGSVWMLHATSRLSWLAGLGRPIFMQELLILQQLLEEYFSFLQRKKKVAHLYPDTSAYWMVEGKEVEEEYN